MNRKMKTRLKEGAPQVETSLTLDFSDVSREELEEQASRSLAIDWQNEARKAGAIPTEAVMNVREFLDRERKARTPQTPEAMLAKLSPEELAALFAKFQDKLEDASE